MSQLTPAPATAGRASHVADIDPITAALVLAAYGLLVLFARWFDPRVMQWRVDTLWAGAIVVWVVAIRRLTGPPHGLLPSWPSAHSLLLPAALLAVFAAAWLPFYDNWRWAYTGDSVVWFSVAAEAAAHGLPQNLLSTHGVDNNFTLLHGIAFNALLFVFGPTFFWHRVGKLIISCLSLAAIYTYFATTLGRRWAAAILVGTATNYVWLWFSYVSYGHIDSHIYYFLTLVLATIVWQHPDHLGAWMTCGLLGGLSLFFTQTSWSVVAAAGIVFAVFGFATRRYAAVALYALSFLLVASPVLLQVSALLDMTTRQTRSIYTWPYLTRIFREILLLPAASPYHHIGVDGAFLRWPLGHLYAAGVALAALGLLPPLRRVLRVPPVAPLLLVLLLWDAILLTLTNNGYESPSTKRAYNLIPLQVFFALLPGYILAAWGRRWKWFERGAFVLVGAALTLSAGANSSLLLHPARGIYGGNVMDGLIELRQRFPDRVLLLETRPGYREALAPDSFFDQSYHLRERVTLETQITEAAIEHACDVRMLVCYEPNMDQERFEPLRRRYAGMLEPLPLLNSIELVCYRCDPTLGGRSGGS